MVAIIKSLKYFIRTMDCYLFCTVGMCELILPVAAPS